MVRILVACISILPIASVAGAQQAPPLQKHEFRDNDSGKSGLSRGVSESKIEPTKDLTALKFTLIDKDEGPIEGIVLLLTGPKGKKFYSAETDAAGYAELLVPKGKVYDLEYLSLGRRKIAAKVPVENEPNQTIKLTLRYKRIDDPETVIRKLHTAPRFVLKGVEFDTNKATIRPVSFPDLDRVVEYMTYKTKSRIRISGHTDDVGKAKANKKLSQDRAESCRQYLIDKGIDGSRVEAVGYGEERPIATNTTEEGRQRNRRIEAEEI